MSQTTEIVAVSMTGAVGLGGIAATAWEAWWAKPWEAAEERVVEIRELLDLAGGAISAGIRTLDATFDARADTDEEEAAEQELDAAIERYRHGDSNPGFRRERAAS